MSDGTGCLCAQKCRGPTSADIALSLNSRLLLAQAIGLCAPKSGPNPSWMPQKCRDPTSADIA